MKNLVKKHHVATALHNLNAFLHEVSVDMEAIDARLTSLQAREPATAMATVRNLEEEVRALSSRVNEIEIEGIGTVTVHEPASDILYPSEQCGVNIPWVEFGNDIVSKAEWGKLSLAADRSKALILEELFITAKEEGFDTVRFWLFPSLWHNNGTYTAEMIDEAADSTQALCIAARNAGVQLVPTLLSFDNWSKDKVKDGGTKPYSNPTHAPLMQAAINALADNKDVVDYVDIINEPEWSVTGIPNADPNPEMDATSPEVMGAIIQSIAIMAQNAGLRFGYGSASLKWADSGLLKTADVVDYHAYEGWSTRFFPPTKVAANSKTYMGETDVPYAEWFEFFADNRYDKVFLWLESKDYTDDEESISTDVLRETLRKFKGA